MSFLLSKVLWELVRPSTLLLLTALCGALLLWSRLYKTGRALLVGSLLLLLLPALLPLAALLERPLENHFPQPALPPRVDGIVILGGAENPATSAARQQAVLNGAGERWLKGLELAQRYPEAKLVFSGGSSALAGGGLTSATVAERLFNDFGVDPARTVLESRSRNTYENARYTAQQLRPRAGETWVLITSAMHLPRAVGLYRKAGWQVIPYPVDYRSSGRARLDPSLRFAEEMENFDAAVREWLGLVAYRLMGRTNALFPEVRPAETR